MSRRLGDVESAEPWVRRSRTWGEPISGDEVRDILRTSGDGVDPHFSHGAEGVKISFGLSCMCFALFWQRAQSRALRRFASRLMAVWLKIWRPDCSREKLARCAHVGSFCVRLSVTPCRVVRNLTW